MARIATASMGKNIFVMCRAVSLAVGSPATLKEPRG